MKNNYKLTLLKKETVLAGEEKALIFFKLLDFTDNRKYGRVVENILDLTTELNEEFYYVAHKYVVYKGASRKFGGELVVASKSNLIDFIESATRSGELRSLLI